MRIVAMAVVVGFLATLPASAQCERVSDSAPGSAGIASPVVLKQVPQIYPAKARGLNVRGAVTLDLTVRTTGQPTNIRLAGVDLAATDNALGLLLADARLDRDAAVDLGFSDAAVASVSQWRWRPATRNGIPVAARTTVTLRFEP